MDIKDARQLFPATERFAYFNTATVGLASRALTDILHAFVDEWSTSGLDLVRGEIAGEHARHAVARLIGADPADLALISSVSSAAGLVAAQFGPAGPGQNVVIGEREYTSNHFPWRLLAPKGYDVRQVPFRHGGLEPDDIAQHVDAETQLIAVSGVQTASGFHADLGAISAIAREVGALVFVDGAQLVGALPVAADLAGIDVLAVPDHKFLLHAGRGLGYVYLSPTAQERFTPVNAGWKAARDVLGSFLGPKMELSPTASRFDNSISWIAAIGNEAALAVLAEFGADAIYARNRYLAAELRAALTDIGWAPAELPIVNQSTIVSVPLGDQDPHHLLAALKEQGVIAAERDGKLRLSVHFYNHEDDIARLSAALSACARPA